MWRWIEPCLLNGTREYAINSALSSSIFNHFKSIGHWATTKQKENVLTPEEWEAFIFFLVVPKLLDSVTARSGDFRQHARILAGLAERFTGLTCQETVSVPLLALVIKHLTGAIRAVIVPTLKGSGNNRWFIFPVPPVKNNSRTDIWTFK